LLQKRNQHNYRPSLTPRRDNKYHRHSRQFQHRNATQYTDRWNTAIGQFIAANQCQPRSGRIINSLKSFFLRGCAILQRYFQLLNLHSKSIRSHGNDVFVDKIWRQVKDNGVSKRWIFINFSLNFIAYRY